MNTNLRHTLAILSLALLTPAALSQVIVDDAGSARNGKVGYWSSLVATGGDVAISYYCEQDTMEAFTLRFAWADASGWQHTTVDYSAGSDTSMARSGDGLYHIVYDTWAGMGYATGLNTAWSVGTVPLPAGVSPANISMVLDSAGHPHVVYMNWANGGDRSLRYARYDGQRWVTTGSASLITLNAWTPTIGFSNTYLALDPAGTPHVAFAMPQDAINAFGPIKYATLQNGAWSLETLPISGEDPSLAIGSDGVPRLMFNGLAGVVYAFKSGGVWQFETVVPNESGSSVTMALSDANVPSACFGLTANEDMYLASRAGGVWSLSMIDGDGTSDPHKILGRYGTSLDIDSAGVAHVGYLDIDIYGPTHRCDLKYFGPGGGGTPTCVAFVRPPVGATACPGTPAAFSVQVSGSGPFSYQWQWQPAAGVWQAVAEGVNTRDGQPVFSAAGATLADLTVTDLTGMLGAGPLFRCEAAAACGSSASPAAMLTIGSTVTIASQPVSTSSCSSATAGFSVSSPDATAFRWQAWKGGDWMDLVEGLNTGGGASCMAAGVNTAALTLGPAPQSPGSPPELAALTVRCVLGSACSELASDPATLSVTGPCCGSSDFNGDGDYGTDSDIEDFFACLAGDCCEECDAHGSDFNGDGDYGTDADIEAFFRVLAGGNC